MQIRVEKDFLGEKPVPVEALYGIHTARALGNFPLTGRPVHSELVRAYGTVKLACFLTNRELGFWKDNPLKVDAIERACREMSEGLLSDHVVVDQLQGGAGTSTNMNVNEVIANRALQLCGRHPGEYDYISPLADINLHQSTNDTFPTALRLAAIRSIGELERQIVDLQESFQEKEKQFAHIVKVGRTQMQDAVLTTLGREMSAYAEAVGRDRWRLYKCEERLRVINLGGTAIGTGLAAPRKYIFRVAETLRELTRIGFARAENMIDATQNSDVLVETSGIMKASATTLVKISTDLRLLSSGPEAGFGELLLPMCQAGSSIMPGKANPVIPEAVTQAALQVIGNDSVLTAACYSGSLELNPFMPLIASCLLESCSLLAAACKILRTRCIEGLEADEERCGRHVEASTAVLTALVAALGYEKCSWIAERVKAEGRAPRLIVVESGLLSEEEFSRLISPEAVCRLGH